LVWTGPTPPQPSSDISDDVQEHTQSFGLGCSSVGVEYHTRCAEALINSLNCTTPRHAKITKTFLLKQITNLNMIADALIVANKISSLPRGDDWTII